ncbi:MAG: hypothetical protein OHK0052_13880 [Anaerolineales bacterium]
MKISPPLPAASSWRVRLLYLWRRAVKPISPERRGEVQMQLRDSSHPDFDFFLLVFLSCVIATEGLLTNSAAVIIGAMLVAPLMSPIIGMGLASITGDSKLLRDAVSALGRGALVAIGLAMLLTWGNTSLPFISLQDLPNEILARTRPSPPDLVIALAGGVAAAYALAQPHISAALPGVAIATALMPPLCTVGIGLALGRWEIAGGALLLFITNAVTIAFAATLVFFALGFAPRQITTGNRRLPRSLTISALLTATLLIPLTYISVQFFYEGAQNRLISSVVNQQIAALDGAELVDLQYDRSGNTINMELTVRTARGLRYDQVVALQRAIVDGLQTQVSLIVNQVLAEKLDPLIPPTPTRTPTATYTVTPGPSPTTTPTVTHTPTITASPTFTPSPTATFTPSPTATFTPTPYDLSARLTQLPGFVLRQSPGGPVIATLRNNQTLTVLYGRVTLHGLVWVEVRDPEGRVGWVPEIYLLAFTPTPTTTP